MKNSRRDFLTGAAATALGLSAAKASPIILLGDEPIPEVKMTKEHVGPFVNPVPFLFGHTGLNFSLANDEKTLRTILDWYQHQGIANPDGPKAVIEFFMGFGEGAIDLSQTDSQNIKRFKHIGPILEEYNVVGTALAYPHDTSGADMISTDGARRKLGTDYVKMVSKVAFEAYKGLQVIGPWAAEAVREDKRKDRPYDLKLAIPHLTEAAEYAAKLNENCIIAFEPLRNQESVISTVAQGTGLIKKVNHPTLKYHADTAHGGEEAKYSGPGGLIVYANTVAPIAATFHISERAAVTDEMLAGEKDYDPKNRAALQPDGQVGSQLDGIVGKIIAANNPILRVTCETPIAAMRGALLRGEPLPGFDKYASEITHKRESYTSAGQCTLMMSLAVDKATGYVAPTKE